MVEVEVFAEAEVNPTEDEAKVRLAISNVLGGAEFTSKPAARGSVLVAHAKGQASLIKLRNLMRSDRIRDAARRVLFKSIRGNTLLFFLNKQVAFAGHVSFSEETAESPLGPIRFTVETDDAQQLVEWLAEKTEKA
ncbi:MAG: hypothetical protein NWE93_03400 [Candidatus Bathyarchaeota archaeon]|nr:hypothetical protein [Candidatus Bathyarchaeota archaeon]